MAHDPVITADDVVRAGACSTGVAAAVQRLAGRIAAAMPASAVLRLVPTDQREYVSRAAELDGYGYGDGVGYGDGYGVGYGDGYGYGYGDGDGAGDGYGVGYGVGDGYGNGESA